MILDVRCMANPGGPCVETHRVERGGTVRVIGPQPRRGRHRFSSMAARASVTTHGAGLRGDARQRRRDRARRRPQRSRHGPGRSPAAVRGAGPAWWSRTAAATSAPTSRWALRARCSVAVSKPRTDLLRRRAEGGLQLPRGRSRADGPAGRSRPPRPTDGRASWDRPGAALRALRQRVLWSGAVGGRVPSEGRYAFRITALGAASKAGLRAARSAPGDESRVALRPHVPGAWPARLRQRRSPVRRGAIRPLPSGPGRLRRLRHATGRRPRRQGASSPASTPPPATTS